MRADRLDLLARVVRDRPGITSDALARELGVSERSGPLRERIFVARPASDTVRASYRVPDRASSRQLQAAFVAATIVNAGYEKEDGSRMLRRLEPHALLISWPAWYLLAFDHVRN